MGGLCVLYSIPMITQAGVTCSRSHETLKGGMVDNPPLVMLLAQAVSMRCNVEEVKGGSGPA
ncbi:hypothetical protein BGY98DRAFT_966916 [Russula aff. rugulosa BPL654]|nr:hypothetical protein BGY98DRAFT_966916 [Russula aff. rugulosa BPL654]